jgi:hypothetical protein
VFIDEAVFLGLDGLGSDRHGSNMTRPEGNGKIGIQALDGFPDYQEKYHGPKQAQAPAEPCHLLF